MLKIIYSFTIVCAVNVEVSNCDCSSYATIPVSGKPGVFICTCDMLCSISCPMNQFYSNKDKICKICGSSSEGVDSFVCTMCSLQPLMQFFGSGCVCGPGTTGGQSNCQCLNNYKPSADHCTCQFLSSDGVTCLTSCPNSQIISQSKCVSCTSGQVPNVAKNQCVSKYCAGSHLNTLGTFCASSCEAESAQVNNANQCVLCTSLNHLSYLNISSCECGPGTSGTFPNCQCQTNYSPGDGQCTCTKNIATNGLECLDQCPTEQISVNTKCQSCISGQISNEAQTECVFNKVCNPLFLNSAENACISSCSQQQAVSNEQNQCKPCSFFDPLSSWKTTDCQCVKFTLNSYPSCACLPNFDNQGDECVCRSGRFISFDETDCLDQCPPENIVSGNRCSECEDHLVPNVAKSSCVDRKCEGAILNPDWSFCVAECQSGLAPDSSNQCRLCADINQYAVWDDQIQSCACGEQTVGDYRECKFCWQVSLASDYSRASKSCRCGSGTSGVFPNCRCLDNFEEILGSCRCGLKLTADGRCVYKCPPGQISPSGAGLCRQCADNKIANYDQTVCVQRNGCAPYFLSVEQNQCVLICSSNAEIVNNVCQCVASFFLIEDACQQPSQVTTCSQSIITLAGTLSFCSRSEIASNARISRNIAVSTNSNQFSFFRMLTRVKNSDINLNIWFGQAPVSLSFAADALISSSQISIVTGGSAGYLVSYYGFAQLLDCDLTFIHIGSTAGLILKGKIIIQNSVLYFKANHFVFEDVVVKSSKLIGNGAGFEGGNEIVNSCASFVIDCAGCKLENLTQC
ncbi:Cysteine-rich_membrane protein 2 [Hexamita inflata]|uniref:Cysteine-rich membrane protein 2 n=1 Tax=Hexamita inflata TaxID=28002 RepID=A0AA86QK64_9EUKA|nr:Cysteine-rich membrane protein 2 [Hexamita inflata]